MKHPEENLSQKYNKTVHKHYNSVAQEELSMQKSRGRFPECINQVRFFRKGAVLIDAYGRYNLDSVVKLMPVVFSSNRSKW